MRVLERVAARFSEAGVPLMALKGAALLLTLYDRLDARAMDDVDLLVRPADFDRACGLLEGLGAVRGAPLVREDFCPRFHYEVEYLLGGIFPTRIDLHVRPFRPMRYARFMPDEALFHDARTVGPGGARLLVPSVEGMLIHLAVHAAVHGFSRPTWVRDIADWTGRYGRDLRWEYALNRVREWRLVLPFREAMARAERQHGPLLPTGVRARLLSARVNWRDRLALRQAPRDAERPVAHVLVNALCTPGPGYVAAYLWSMAVPGRRHMAGWYGRRHWGWLSTARTLRWVRPMASRLFWRPVDRPASAAGAGL